MCTLIGLHTCGFLALGIVFVGIDYRHIYSHTIYMHTYFIHTGSCAQYIGAEDGWVGYTLEQ